MKAKDIDVVTKIAKKCPDTTIILDHLAYAGTDLDHFKKAIKELSGEPNVCLKLCGLEEWIGVDNHVDYLEFAL